MDSREPRSSGNPYAAAFGIDDSAAEVALESPPLILASLAKRPRWWTPLAVIALSLGIFLSVSLLAGFLAVAVVHGSVSLAMFRDPAIMDKVLKSRVGLMLLLLIPQLSMILPPLVAAYLSPVEMRKRLALVRGHWPIWVWFAAAAATPLVGMISSIIVGRFMQDSETLKQMSEVFRFHGESGFLLPIAFLVGATPAICEELLFRGYVQTRLTRSWGPFFGISLSSLLFAAFHMDYVHIVAVFPLGVYLGWLTWRSGSLFPAMLAHFVNNFISVVAVTMAPGDQADMLGAPSVAIFLSILGFGVLGVTTVIMASIYFGRPPEVATT